MKKRNIIMSVIMTIVSVVFVYLVKVIDVKSIGPKGTSVGFASINSKYIKLVGTNLDVYKLSELVGYVIL